MRKVIDEAEITVSIPVNPSRNTGKKPTTIPRGFSCVWLKDNICNPNLEKSRDFFERLKVSFQAENKHFTLKGNFIMKDLMRIRLINF